MTESATRRPPPLADARILHLFANYKWTGPADPALRCAQGLRELGEDVVFAQAEWTLPAAEHRMATELRKSRLPVIGGLELRKHMNLFSLRRDERSLARRLRSGEFDVVNAHLPADHLIAALAVRRAKKRGAKAVLVRSLYDAEPPRRTWRTKLAFAMTDAVIAPTREVAAALPGHFGLAPGRVLWLEPGTALVRRQLTGDLRTKLGIAPGQIAIGITARIQPHRRFDLLGQVAKRVVTQAPEVRFVLLGRGNAKDTKELVQDPVKQLDLEKHVILPGYLYEPEYSLALRGLDLFLFLVPGSDGTCRAVREALALGLPVVSTPRGMLPGILAPMPEFGIEDACGIVAEETAEALAAGLLTLARDPQARGRASAAARAKAEGPMNPVQNAAAIAALYRELLAVGGS